MSENREKDLQNFIEWCIEYNNIPEGVRNKLLNDAYDEIKDRGFDNISSNIYPRLISFYTCKLLKDKNSSKYVSSIINNSNVDISSIDNLYNDVGGARKLAKSLLLFNKGYKNTSGDYLDYLQKFMELDD